MNIFPKFRSFSQAAQDRFVNAVLAGKHGGTFLDVGCCHPTELSNTYALESHFAWRGLLVDNDPGAVKLCREQRISPAIEADATTLNFDAAIREAWKSFNAHFGDIVLAKGYALPKYIDYLSLDVDAATVLALRRILNTGIRFRVITVEHDAYRFGDEPRAVIRHLLMNAGYAIVCANVRATTGEEFEDWLIDPVADGVDLDACERLHCIGKKWTEIFPT